MGNTFLLIYCAVRRGRAAGPPLDPARLRGSRRPGAPFPTLSSRVQFDPRFDCVCVPRRVEGAELDKYPVCHWHLPPSVRSVRWLAPLLDSVPPRYGGSRTTTFLLRSEVFLHECHHA